VERFQFGAAGLLSLSPVVNLAQCRKQLLSDLVRSAPANIVGQPMTVSHQHEMMCDDDPIAGLIANHALFPVGVPRRREAIFTTPSRMSFVQFPRQNIMLIRNQMQRKSFPAFGFPAQSFAKSNNDTPRDNLSQSLRVVADRQWADVAIGENAPPPTLSILHQAWYSMRSDSTERPPRCPRLHHAVS